VPATATVSTCPAIPRLLSFCPTACPTLDIAVKGDHAFVADNSRTISVYDISDRKTWRRIASGRCPLRRERHRQGRSGIRGGCQAAFRSSTSRPKQAGSCCENRLPKQDIDAIDERQRSLSVRSRRRTLRLVDVTDPANTKHLSVFEFGRPFIQGEMDLCRGYAYCGRGEFGVVVVDVRDSRSRNSRPLSTRRATQVT